MGIRIASAAVLGPIALACLWYGGWAWRGFIAAAMAGLAWEWGVLAGSSRPWAMLAFMACLWFDAVLIDPGTGLLMMVFITGLVAWFYGQFSALGIPYAGVGALALLWLRLLPNAGLSDTLFLVLVVWGTDIGAYTVGRTLGGPRMAPRISPGKTWSGAVGGLCVGALAGAFLAGGFRGIDAAALPAGGLLSIFAQAGDLLESAIKRRLGVKDSGRTIPGHGGLFDRLDGFLTAAPVAALLAYLAPGGGVLWR